MRGLKRAVLRLDRKDPLEAQIAQDIETAPRKQEFIRQLIRNSFEFKLLFWLRKDAIFSARTAQWIWKVMAAGEAVPSVAGIMTLADSPQQPVEFVAYFDPRDEFEESFISSYRDSRDKSLFMKNTVKIGYFFRALVLEKPVMSGIYDPIFNTFVYVVTARSGRQGFYVDWDEDDRGVRRRSKAPAGEGNDEGGQGEDYSVAESGGPVSGGNREALERDVADVIGRIDNIRGILGKQVDHVEQNRKTAETESKANLVKPEQSGENPKSPPILDSEESQGSSQGTGSSGTYQVISGGESAAGLAGIF